MPPLINPHRIPAPFVWTYSVTLTPEQNFVSTGLQLNNNAILLIVVQTTTPEQTGTTPELIFSDENGHCSYGKCDVTATGIVTVYQIVGTNAPDPNTHLCYAASSNDWNEFRGTIKTLYLPWSQL